MKLMTVFKEPDLALDYMERLVNDGSPSRFSFVNTTSKETCPLYTEAFNLCAIHDEKSEFSTFGFIPSFTELEHFEKDFIFVHPDWKNIIPETTINKTNLVVRPTSSSRTVKVDRYNCYIKMSYPGVLGRITRELKEEHIKSSIDVSNILEKLISDSSIPTQLAFFAERGGKIYHHHQYGDIGYVVRDMKPSGKNIDKICAVIPAFSLFSSDRQSDDEPLIVQILKHKGDEKNYLLEQLAFRIIDCYFSCVFKGGIQPEMHSQNFLLGFDSNLNVISIILRDLESVDKDITIINQKNLFSDLKSYPYKCISQEQYNYKIKHSFMYDHKLCEYFFDQLFICLERHKIIKKKNMEQEIRNYVIEKYGQTLINFFPDDGKWYKFENVLIDRSISNRPYKKNDNPKYR